MTDLSVARPMRIYVASSWRNDRQPDVVASLDAHGFSVYDFRHPAPGDDGFHWHEIDLHWKRWDARQFVEALGHPIAVTGFAKDMGALRRADAVVLVAPCGISAHLELGWALGAGKPGLVLLADGEPEMMYKMATRLCTTLEEVVADLAARRFPELSARRFP